MKSRLAGIARHDRPRGEIETLQSVAVTRAAGIGGDYRGAMKPGRNRRQVSLIEAESWAAAMADLRLFEPWWKRRANLLIEGCGSHAMRALGSTSVRVALSK